MKHYSAPNKNTSPYWAEFFAGGGMARAGLGSQWNCVFANDLDPHKLSSYRSNWDAEHLIPGDIAAVSPELIPDSLDLAWASTPCQNFSSAGLGNGLLGNYSSAFLTWWNLIQTKQLTYAHPKLIVLENVRGLLKSRKGEDFRTLAESFAKAGYSFGVMLLDAVHFLPQSRPRIFIVAVREDQHIPNFLYNNIPNPTWHPSDLVEAVANLPTFIRDRHIWWEMPIPSQPRANLAALLENDATHWHSLSQTQKLLESMSPSHCNKIRTAIESGIPSVGTLFRRMRPHEGKTRSFTEVRFDGVAGCLRASDGGSSRQMLIFVNGESIKTRHMTSRESARLMGLPDEYQLPNIKTHAVKLIGDGVAVPVVKFLDDHLLSKLTTANHRFSSRTSESHSSLSVTL